jgi:hypothetical protein
MSINDYKITETVMEIGAGMARALGMNPEEDMTTLMEGQRVMMVTETGTVIGKIRVDHMETHTARFETYFLNGIVFDTRQLDGTVLSESPLRETVLSKYRFGANCNGGFFEEPDIACSLPVGAILYTR